VLIPDGYIALGKLSQAMMYGAEIVAIQGNFDRALEVVREISEKYPITLVNSVNPYRIEGQKTGAFEICEALGQAPDYHFIPVGNAGNITAYWKGYKEWFEAGKIPAAPKMMGFEAEGAAAIVKGERIMNPETLATAIRIGNPASWQKAEAARDESNGMINFVTDDEIVAAYKLIASSEGVLAEPASAASVAGLIKVKSQVKEGSKIVCILTGNGLKDPDNAIKYSNADVKKTSSDINDILKVMNI
jgi:threonine synthase